MLEKHEIRDAFQIECDNNKKILSQKTALPPKTLVDGNLMRIQCKYSPKCQMTFAKPLAYRRHEKYHADLKMSKKSPLDFSHFPCLHANCVEKFGDYNDAVFRTVPLLHHKFENMGIFRSENYIHCVHF